MIKDITIGQYYPVTSAVHRLDPRTKIILTIAYIVYIFICKNFLSLGLVSLLLLITILFTKVPVKMYLRNFKAIIPILIFTAIMNIFYSDSGNLLFSYKAIHIYSGGIFTAMFIAVRIFLLIIASSVLTYTTTPTLLTDGIERLLSPLTKLHIDVHTFAMMMTLALRFIPTLMEEIERIMNAQKARGADFESGNFLSRAKALVPIMVPLIVSAVKRAYELAFAMECRCYNGGQGRTRMKRMSITFKDFVAGFIYILFLAGLIVLNSFFGSVL